MSYPSLGCDSNEILAASRPCRFSISARPKQRITTENSPLSDAFSTMRNFPSSIPGDDEGMEMEAVWSDLHALKKLYGLLQRTDAMPESDSKDSLDEQSRLLLKKLLDGATQEALRCHSKMLTHATDSAPQNPQREQQSSHALSPIPGGAPEEGGLLRDTKQDKNPRPRPDCKGGIELKRQKSNKMMKPHKRSQEQPVLQDRYGNRHRARSGRSSVEDAPNGARHLMRLASQRGGSPKRSRVDSPEPSRSGLKVPPKSTERRSTDCGSACCSLTRRPESFGTNQTPEIARNQRKEVGPTKTKLLDSQESSRRGLSSRLQKPPIHRTSPRPPSPDRQDMEARPLEVLEPHHRKKTAMKDDRVGSKRQSPRMPSRLRPMRRSALSRSSGSSGSMPNSSKTSTAQSDSESSPRVGRPTRPSARRMPSHRWISSSRPSPAPQPELASRRERLPRWMASQREMAVGLPRASSGRDHQKKPEKREGRLKRLKNKLAIIFHHHHHHHHYQHDEGVARQERPQVSPSRYVGNILQNTSKKDHRKLATKAQGERAAERTLGQRRHGHLHGLFAALLRHIWGTSQRRAAQAKQTLRGKKLHWWHKFRRRGGVKLAIPRKPRLHLGSATTRLSGNKHR